MSARERYLVVGLGSIGKRHLECLRQIRPEADITVWRQHHRDAAVPPEADRVVFDIDEALAQKPVAAIVANPAPMHIETATRLAEAGLHLLVEKPISDSIQHVAALIALCERKKLTLAVGYVLRFHRGLLALRDAVRAGRIGRILSFRAEVGQYLPDWRPHTDYRQGVSARKELGGGVLLELSHELDYVRWIFGEPVAVSAVMTRSGTLEADVEDAVDAILEVVAPDGQTINGTVHLDMLQRLPVRYCRAIGTEGSLEWDAIAGTTKKFDPGTKQGEILADTGGESRNELFVRQLQCFLAAIERGSPPEPSGHDGLAALRMVEAIRVSSRDRKTITLQ